MNQGDSEKKNTSKFLFTKSYFSEMELAGVQYTASNKPIPKVQPHQHNVKPVK